MLLYFESKMFKKKAFKIIVNKNKNQISFQKLLATNLSKNDLNILMFSIYFGC